MGKWKHRAAGELETQSVNVPQCLSPSDSDEVGVQKAGKFRGLNIEFPAGWGRGMCEEEAGDGCHCPALTLGCARTL